ncbi:MAG TPA: FAD-dependent oxidoreductase [Leptospiraceae bacterium]|nr:FAD-dependent oxidoreductase [Leptospirales bacterium]HMU82271.1 FAD-dependent oxidoreductase [Leptospiraceae bacterium]HMW59033.1 FAD-dependent oxidoreductase [Leptospiraceae bacterium]HMX58119.1 FAD-dependent oxidoreductase [Leptospiraceae bacterium]HMZ35637.1 FAD-dependent oxidoreductase [Leptospiraceae bacterium]
MKRTLAIVGSGISGMGALYALRDEFAITLYEKADRIGGHTHTVTVEDPSGPLPVDTGFIVYNTTTYPLLTRLFEELKIKTEWSDMSFGVQNLDTGLEWAGHNLGSVFAQKKNLLRPAFWRMVLEILRFNRTALRRAQENSEEISLGDFLRNDRYSDYFIDNYIVPMGSAVWSTPARNMLDFPARTFIEFFSNHGFLEVERRVRWRTVSGGSHSYIKAILDEGKPEIQTGQPVTSVRRTASGKVEVTTPLEKREFDFVLMASHANETLSMLADPTHAETELLSHFHYQKNEAVLHFDESVLPSAPQCHAAWNFRTKSGVQAIAYSMKRLQNIKSDRHYIVSLGEFERIDEKKIIRSMTYEHPLFDLKTAQAQKSLHLLNETGPIFFSGSYFRYGFHEDGLWSASLAARRILDVSRQLVHV